MKVFHRALGIACAVLLLVTPAARAQSQTGAITGEVTDTSGAVLPGVTVSVSGDKLIGGVQTKVTDATGNYRFDRLPPGSYNIKFELQGFKTIDRQGIRDHGAVRRDGQPEARSGQRGRDDHGHGRVAHDRHQIEPAADGHEPGDSRGRAVGARSLVGGEDHPGRVDLDV